MSPSVAFEWQTCSTAELVVRIPGLDLTSTIWLTGAVDTPDR